MDLRVKLDPLAYLPERAHPTDAGVDLRTPHDVLVMLPVAYPDVVQAEEITGGPRGNDGYGSTGR